jgi:hypothetical protein
MRGTAAEQAFDPNRDDAEIVEYLRDNGYPEYLCREGKAGLINRWRQFVEDVERGYEYGLEDYRNDLDFRGVIALFGLDAEVADADERLERMLVDREARVWESAPGNPFWDFGYPENATARLRRDLEAAGLMQRPEDGF